VLELIGRMNQHTNRTTRYSVTHAKLGTQGQHEPEHIQKSMDYDCRFKLPMHTDHSQFPGMPGYLQFMQNLQGPVDSYVCDGLAVAEYLETNFPDQYQLLTTVPVTHSFRNKLYTKGGSYRDMSAADDAGDPTDPYEVCHTHPVIILGPDGGVERIAHSETKRGVCAIPYDVYDEYMGAYRHWTSLVDDPRFVHRFHWPENGVAVCNNYRVLHGRADLAPVRCSVILWRNTHVSTQT
jgi:alpha-ketoglutarate-dependent taurine dioxygenase